MGVSAAFASVLASGRPQFNARVAEARRRTPGFAVEAFGAFLEASVDPLVAAVEAVDPARTGAVALAAFDVALVLTAQGRAGPGSRSPGVDRLWTEVLPRLARPIAQAPGELLGALSNAAIHLDGHAEVRGDEWRQRLAALGPRAPSAAALLDLGKLLAWRCGAAHFRAGALQAGDALPAELALAAIDGAPQTAWPEVRARFLADPWWSPDGQGRQAREVGAFTGFGGSFAEPPVLRVAPDGFWVRSGERCHLLVADAWGAVLLPATAEEFEAAPHDTKDAKVAVPTLKGSELVFAARTVALQGTLEGLQILADAHTAAVTSPYSHAIRLYALQ